MTNEEFEKLCDAMRAQGMTDDDILGTILQMFKDGKISVDEMGKLAGSLGYELTDEFLEKSKGLDRMPTKDSDVDEDKGEITEEEVKDAQEVDSDDKDDNSDDEEEFEEEEEEDEEYESDSDEDEDSDEEEEEDSDEEEEEESEDEEENKKEAHKWFFD